MTQNLPEPTADPAKRASDADRDQVIERLRDAAGEGRIDFAEFEERMGAAYQARTYGELAGLTADLPDAPSPAAPAAASPPPPELVLHAQGSSVRRDGPWPVPRRLVVDAEHGSVRLDLTRAVLPAGEVEVEITAKHSSVVLLIPYGTQTVEDGLASHWSSVSYGGGRAEDPDTPAAITAGVPGQAAPPREPLRLRITGELHHSSVNVRPPRRRGLWSKRIRAWWRRLVGRARPALPGG